MTIFKMNCFSLALLPGQAEAFIKNADTQQSSAWIKTAKKIPLARNLFYLSSVIATIHIYGVITTPPGSPSFDTYIAVSFSGLAMAWNSAKYLYTATNTIANLSTLNLI